MSTLSHPERGEGSAVQGTVFDIGYQRFTGTREGRDRALRAVFKDGVRASLGLGRPPRAKVLPWFFIGLLCLIALIMVLVAGAAERIGGPGTAERQGLPSFSDFYAFASIIMYVFAAVVGPELLCRDRREGVINLYLVRPLTSTDYLVARWTAFFAVMLAAAWLPQIVLFFGLALGDLTPLEYLKKHWVDAPRFLVSGMIVAGYLTTLALLTASFTKRHALASVFLVGLFAISSPFTLGMAQEIGGKVGQWVSMFSLTNIPLHVVDIMFDNVSEITEDAPARELGSNMLVAWYFVWTLVPAAILWWRYRRLTP